MTFDPTEPVRTRSGLPARIICTDRLNYIDGPIVSLVTLPEDDRHGGEVVRFNYANGCYRPSGDYDDFDLVNIPVETVRFQPVYLQKHVQVSGDSYATLSSLITSCPSRIGHIVLKYEDDELKDISYVPR